MAKPAAVKKPAAKGDNKAKTTTATKAKPAAKAKEAAAKPKAATKELVVLAPNTFAKFLGYSTDVAEQDRAFQKGDAVYITAVTPGDNEQPTMYEVISPKDVKLYLEDPESEELVAHELAVQEVVEMTGTALGQLRDNFMPIPSVGRLDEILSEAGDDALEAARHLHGEIEQSYFYLGGVLAKVRQEGTYLTENGGSFEGETAWDDFCQAEFGFGGAKAGDLARLYTTFAALPNFDPEAMAGIGWSKVRETQRYVTEANYAELLEIARETPKSELKVKLVEMFASEDGKTPSGKAASRSAGAGASNKMAVLTFKLSEDENQAMQLAMKEAKKLYGVQTDAEALARIVMAWAQDHVQSATAKKAVEKRLSPPAAKTGGKQRVAA